MSRRALTAVTGVVAGLVGLLFASLVAASRADDAYEAWADRAFIVGSAAARDITKTASVGPTASPSAFSAAAGLGDRVDVPD